MKISQDWERAHEFLPLRPIEFYILLALSEGEVHGYGIVRATEDRAGSDIRLDTGTLYRALFRLREAGLVEEADRRAAEDLGGRRRRYYRLTTLGHAVAVVEARRLAGLVRDATLAKLLNDPETV